MLYSELTHLPLLTWGVAVGSSHFTIFYCLCDTPIYSRHGHMTTNAGSKTNPKPMKMWFWYCTVVEYNDVIMNILTYISNGIWHTHNARLLLTIHVESNSKTINILCAFVFIIVLYCVVMSCMDAKKGVTVQSVTYFESANWRRSVLSIKWKLAPINFCK